MPIISRVGSRSFKVRFVYGMIFLILGIGAVSMIYPLLLMLSGSVKSDADYLNITPIPEYFFDDAVLWKKFVESKYGSIPIAEAAFQENFGSWRRIQVPEKIDENVVEAYRAFRDQPGLPTEWFTVGHVNTANNMLPQNAREFRRTIQEKYDGDIVALSRDLGVRYSTWSQVSPPAVSFASRRFTFPQTVNYQIVDDLTERAPKYDLIVTNLDGDFRQTYLVPKWATIKAYNDAHKTHYESYKDVLLSEHVPANPAERADWEEYVRDQLNLRFIRIADAAVPLWRQFLESRYAGGITELNRAWERSFASFEDVKIPTRVGADQPRAMTDLAAFVKKRDLLPAEHLSIYGPRQGFEQFLAERQGSSGSTSSTSGTTQPAQAAAQPLPIVQTDYLDFQQIKSALRKEFLTRNYAAVLDYVLLHGNGIRNTVIYCFLMIATHLLVNPMAAYALSRYRPPSAYTILLFCMCTMAFPGEVTMIPSFLLLKRFPLYSLVVGFAAAALALYLLNKFAPRMAQTLRGGLAVGFGVAAGYWLAPMITHNLFNGPPHVSLLNTFWALVLPGMASGFGIFLLKGFFDSLPKELYEAADIDGANEWHKFWIITMSLSKPILAVMALSAFTHAYSEFMMALVIIPDQKMWTIMVWLFQMQSNSHQTIIYASLVIAAIPTFAVFLFCQNIIMRGIVVPTEK